MNKPGVRHASRVCVMLVLALAGGALLGCGPALLATDDFGAPREFTIDKDAHISATERNRAVLDTILVYRKALEERDPNGLRGVVATDYYENASSTNDTSDDYGNEKLDEILGEYLQGAVEEIRYAINVLQLQEDGEMIHVKYAYKWSFRYKDDGKDHWSSKHDVNKITLVDEDGKWKIAGGL